jgi:hypothetical protein
MRNIDLLELFRDNNYKIHSYETVEYTLKKIKKSADSAKIKKN